MKQQISPETILKIKSCQNFLFKILRYHLKPYVGPMLNFFRLRKWRHNSDLKVFNWDWRKINFNRISTVNLLLNNFDNASYLEIGCASDSLFNSVPVENKVGVDPLSGGNVRKTSDIFFKENKKQFDVIFIDGLHTYEQVRKDIINSISTLNEGGWIVLHDMLPRNWIEQHSPIITKGPWTGDVWKVAFELIQTGGIDFKILKIDHGVGVIKVIKKSVQLKNLQKELLNSKFTYYYDNINKLPIIEWNDAKSWMKNRIN